MCVIYFSLTYVPVCVRIDIFILFIFGKTESENTCMKVLPANKQLCSVFL